MDKTIKTWTNAITSTTTFSSSILPLVTYIAAVLCLLLLHLADLVDVLSLQVVL